MTVTLLLTRTGEPVSVYKSDADAEARRDALNANLHLEPGKPDPDAPYSCETWAVR